MKENSYFFILAFVVSIWCSCKVNTKESLVESGNNRKFSDNHKEEIISRDTIKINPQDIYLFKVLLMLPDISMGKGHDWSMAERKKEYENALNGFMVNVGDDGYHHKEIISNDHLRVSVIDSYWQMKIYAIDKVNQIILTHAHSGDGDTFYVFEFDGKSFSQIHDFFPSNYLDLFFNKPYNRIDYEKKLMWILS